MLFDANLHFSTFSPFKGLWFIIFAGGSRLQNTPITFHVTFYMVTPKHEVYQLRSSEWNATLSPIFQTVSDLHAKVFGFFCPTFYHLRGSKHLAYPEQILTILTPETNLKASNLLRVWHHGGWWQGLGLYLISHWGKPHLARTGYGPLGTHWQLAFSGDGLVCLA